MAKKNKFQIVENVDPNRQRIADVQSPMDISWAQPLHEQLLPQLSGHPTSGKSESEFHLLRKKTPVLTGETFHSLFPNCQASTMEVVNPKIEARHYVELKEAAATILSAIQWFNALEQPMMIVVWTKDWPDAARFKPCDLTLLGCSRHLLVSMKVVIYQDRL